MEAHRSRLAVRYLHCWWVLLLLASFAGTAEASVCIAAPDVVLPVRKELKGLVIWDKDGSALPGTRVRLFQESSTGDLTKIAEAVADGEGRFRMPGVKPGLYTMRWSSEGLGGGEGTFRVRRLVLRYRRAILLLAIDDNFEGCGSWLGFQLEDGASE